MPVKNDIAKTSLKDDFDNLKKTATCIEDVCKWFEKHPEVIPGLAPEFYKLIEVSHEVDEYHFDYKLNTVFDECRFQFSIPSYNEKREKAAFAEITGMALGKNENRDAFFHSVYKTRIDSLEWRYVALNALQGLLPEDLEDPHKENVFKNILSAHFPHQSWDNFVTLWQSGLLPDNPIDLNAALEVSPIRNEQVPVIPTNLSL